MKIKNLHTFLNEAQDTNADISLLQEAIAIESVTGNETPFAHFLATKMNDLGLQTGRHKFLPGRENVWGTTPNRHDRNHSSLMFMGHTDTVHSRGWKQFWQDDARSDPFKATYKDKKIWGRGACDMKGGICAVIAGLRLLQQTGFEIEGKITLAFVGDEESGEPGTGVSAGTKDLVDKIATGKIATPDFVVYVEPTRLDVYTAQIGFFIVDITIMGKTAYFGTPQHGVDALQASHEILSRIWAYNNELSKRPAHDLVGASSILVTSIEGGGLIAVPGRCQLSLIRKLRPEEDLDEAVAELEAVVDAGTLTEGLSVSFNYPARRDHSKGGSSVEIRQDTPAVLLLQACLQEVGPNSGKTGGAPYWSEMPFLVNQVDCPAVYCAPGDISVAHTFEEHIEVNEYLAAVRSFALFMARFCGTKENPNH